MAISQCSLDSLPVEVLRPIIATLAMKELKALRLMNRKLCNVASDTLFKTLAISINAASYIQLLNVAASGLWSAQVTPDNSRGRGRGRGWGGRTIPGSRAVIAPPLPTDAPAADEYVLKHDFFQVKCRLTRG